MCCTNAGETAVELARDAAALQQQDGEPAAEVHKAVSVAPS